MTLGEATGMPGLTGATGTTLAGNDGAMSAPVGCRLADRSTAGICILFKGHRLGLGLFSVYVQFLTADLGGDLGLFLKKFKKISKNPPPPARFRPIRPPTHPEPPQNVDAATPSAACSGRHRQKPFQHVDGVDAQRLHGIATLEHKHRGQASARQIGTHLQEVRAVQFEARHRITVKGVEPE